MKILNMTPELFKFRKRIIKLLYEAREVLGTELPRIKVRIVEFTKENTLGMCFIDKDYITISLKMAPESENVLRQVVWHELAHAYFKAPHKAGCPLMNPSLIRTATKAQLVKALKGVRGEREKISLQVLLSTERFRVAL